MLPPLRKRALLVFLALLGCYLSLSPGTITGMGYSGEEMVSADRMITMADAWRKGVIIPPMKWSRHGPLPVLFDIPFVVAGKFFFNPDFVLSFQPVLFTALMGVVLYLWLRQLASPSVSLIVTLA